MKQRTVGRSLEYTGIEFYGGCEVRVLIEPAEEDSRIVFESNKGSVRADINLARQSKSSIMLEDGKTRVIHVEHILATLYAYGIDNARVRLERIPSGSYSLLDKLGIATDIAVVPVSQDRELTLCKKLDEAGYEEQGKERKSLYLQEPIISEKLSFEKIERGLIISAKTDYPIPGEQKVEFEINSQNYRDELARSRMYVKHLPRGIPKKIGSFLACFAYPQFGIGHGFTPETVFLPVKNAKEWTRQELMFAEIARHSIVDRLGAIALLPGRLEGVKVSAYRSGHQNDINFLRDYVAPKLINTYSS